MKYLVSLFLVTTLFAEGNHLPDAQKKSVSTHQLSLKEGVIDYEATAGTILLKDEEGAVEGEMFYISYIKAGEEKRPVTFCFNGGPGSSSIWLHLGVFGPKIVEMDEEGVPLEPARLVDNPKSILAFTDLVFIDPIATGCSRATSPLTEKKFHSVDGDIQSVSEFIRLWITQNGRWDSPKYLAGESYGTLRAAGVAHHLLMEKKLKVEGIIFISAILSYHEIMSEKTDLSFVNTLPTFAAIAHYHGKVEGDLATTLLEAERFAENDYLKALFQGRLLSNQERLEIAKKLSSLTGIDTSILLKSHLRIDEYYFAKHVVEDQIISFYDGRWIHEDHNWQGIPYNQDHDPSERLFPIYARLFNHYLRSELSWEEEREYRLMAKLWGWNWDYKNAYLNSAAKLEELLRVAPDVRVFLGSGIYDIVTPYFAAAYTFNHLFIPEEAISHITMRSYEAGHMFYLHSASFDRFYQDLSDYFDRE